MTNHGVDLGGDQAGGGRRRRQKLLHMAKSAAARGGGAKSLVKVCRTMKDTSARFATLHAPTLPLPSSTAEPSFGSVPIVAIHKATLGAATGHMAKGASSTLAIQLSFGRADQPDIANPMTSLKAWLGHARHPTFSPAESTAAWRFRCRKIRQARASGIDPWVQTMSVMSHSSFILLDVGINPAPPLVWLWTGMKGRLVNSDMRRPIDAAVNLSCIEDHLTDRVWAKVSTHEGNGGLEQGEPNLTVAKKVVRQLVNDGCHGAWNGVRAHLAQPLLPACSRCGLDADTLLHSLWTCPDLSNSKDACVLDTQSLAHLATSQKSTASALWLGASCRGPPRCLVRIR